MRRNNLKSANELETSLKRLTTFTSQSINKAYKNFKKKQKHKEKNELKLRQEQDKKEQKKKKIRKRTIKKRS